MLHPIQIGAYVLAAILGNLWWLRRWRVPVGRPRPAGERRLLWLLAIAALVALALAGWAMGAYRSEDGFLAVLLFLPVQVLFSARVFFRYNRQLGRPVGWRRLVIGNTLVLLLPLTLALAGGELWFRFCHDTTDSIGYTKVARRWLQRHYVRNQWKLRDNVEYALAIAPGKRRVSFVGDSFTAGHGIEDVEQRFANRVRRMHPDWEVHVLADNGKDTAAEVDGLMALVANGYAVDEVVLVYCLNDIQDLVSGWKGTADAVAKKAAQRWAALDDSYLLDMVYFRVAIADVPGIANYFEFVSEAYRGAVWEEQQKRLRALRDVVTQHGGRLSVVTWPFLHALGKEYLHEASHAQLAGFWHEEGVAHLDLLPVLRGHASAELTVNAFDAHPNEFASEIAANAIDAWLLGVVAKPKSRGGK